MASTYANLIYHIVFSTKYRKPQIEGSLQSRLYDYLGGIIRESDGVLLEIGGMPDHVHLLIKLSPAAAVSDTLRILKTNSSRWVHETLDKKGFGWQTGFGAFTVSQSNLNATRQYIAAQPEHHKRISYREEFLALLKRHQIDFDPNFVFESEVSG